jgi:glycosyltransferase involved in cell wall biosynthesis
MLLLRYVLKYNHCVTSTGGFGAQPHKPRLGVLVTHPIQYQAPLYREISRRGVVDIDVAFLSLAGARPFRDPSFGVTFQWDIDLLDGYRSIVLGREPAARKGRWLARLRRWVRRHDAVVLHGHRDTDILLAMGTCRLAGVPYLLRGDSQAESSATGWRRTARHLIARTAVRGAAGALPIGQRNAAFYRRYGQIPQFPAPYSVDNDRFSSGSQSARGSRTERLAALGLDPGQPTVIYSGKLIAHKRPLDVVHAVERASRALNLIMIGDGALRDHLRGYEQRLPVRVTGFVNQSQLPQWYACGDVLVLPSSHEPWGLVVNEGMACGLIPVVSDAVGCGEDLVAGIGEIYPTGDTDALAAALVTAATDDPAGRRARIPGRLSGFSIPATAAGFEQAALTVTESRLLPGSAPFGTRGSARLEAAPHHASRVYYSSSPL